MRAMSSNKAVQVAEHKTGYDCPTCGQRDRHGCRATPNGPFCIEYGLKFTFSTLHGAVEETEPAYMADPRVRAASKAASAARRAFDDATDEWSDLVARRREAELTARSQPALYSADMTPVFSPETQRHIAEARRLQPLETEAFEAREEAGRVLQEAQVEERDAIARARWAIGG